MIQSQYQLRYEIVDKIKDEGVYSGCKWCARVGVPIETVLSTLGMTHRPDVIPKPQIIARTERNEMRGLDYDYHHCTTMQGSQAK